jgi:hypothetical protein
MGVRLHNGKGITKGVGAPPLNSVECGFSGYKHQKGDKVIALIDNHGYILAPVPMAPVNETDMVLLPQSLQAFR